MLTGIRGAPNSFEVSPGQKAREHWGAIAVEGYQTLLECPLAVTQEF